MALGETATRVAVALVGIPVAVGAVYLGGWTLAALLALVAVLGTLELYRMAEQKGLAPFALLGSMVAAGYVAVAAVSPSLGPDAPGLALLTVLCALAVPGVAIWVPGVERQPLLSSAVTLFGAVYTGLLLSFALFLRHLPGVEGAWHGVALVFAPVLLTWTNDTFAYFVGRVWGTRKLIPRVSPGKTVQGAAGAVVGTVSVAIAYAFLLDGFPAYRLGWLQAVSLGLLVSVAAQVGDLVESLFKRDTGVKDSGTLLPGHGGALDRFDSLFYTLPLAYLFFRYLVEPGAGPGAF